MTMMAPKMKRRLVFFLMFFIGIDSAHKHNFYSIINQSSLEMTHEVSIYVHMLIICVILEISKLNNVYLL